ncbi:MAG: homoserine kinase [Alphaproteobacteria bacterium]|nr:homoserine kinase [Alphaproteobacteria bacterium]
MAVYTHVSAHDIVGFLANYDLGVYEGHRGITQGVENTNYHLQTDRGRYILTIFEKRVRREDLPFIYGFTNHLRHAGITVPDTYADRVGRTVGTLAGKPASIIRFLDGAGVPDADVTPSHCTQVGTTLAQMHKAASTYKQHRENPVGFAQWQKLLSDALPRTDLLSADDIAAIDSALEEYEGLDLHNLPHGAIHADAFPDNVFFRDGTLRGVIDFYFACTDTFVYDTALTINAWCFDTKGQIQPDRLAAFIGAYQQVRPLSDDEREVFPALRRAAALRILSTRLYDWEFTPKDADVVKKDPREYVAKLKSDITWP